MNANYKISYIAVICIMYTFVSVQAKSFECFVLKAPEKILNGVKKIAILSFEGDATAGRAMADYMVASILLETRGIYNQSSFFTSKEGKTYIEGARTNVFDIVERTQLDQILEEQKLSNSGAISEQQATEVGKLLGLDAIIVGNLSYSHTDVAETKKYENPKTGQITYTYCTTRKVIAKARMKIIDVKTAQVIGTADDQADKSQEKCDGERSGLSTASELADIAFKNLAASFVSYFTPTFSLVKYDFERIRTKDFKDKARDAEDYLSRGEIDNAFSIYKAVNEADPYNIEAIDAVGKLYDIVGDYNKALEYWKTAAEIDNRYQKLVNYAENEIKMQEMLIKLGVTIIPHVFEQQTDALSEHVITKGQKKDRFEAKEKPDASSTTIAKVPGATEFVMLEKSGDWCKVKLLGGKEGYLLKNDLK